MVVDRLSKFRNVNGFFCFFIDYLVFITTPRSMLFFNNYFFTNTFNTAVLKREHFFKSFDDISLFVNIRLNGFPLLDVSPWPVFMAFSVFVMISGVASFFNFYIGALWCVLLGFCLFLFGFKYWVTDYIRELTWLRGTKWMYRSNLGVGFLLFIVSEIMFFFSFFWGFFHSSIEPAIQVGGIWPPVEGLPVESLIIPIYNTIILVVSAFALTLTQFSNLEASSKYVEYGFYILFFCAFSFLITQHLEYSVSAIQVCDSVMGSTLYILTSFHGLHVAIGTIYLLIVAFRYWIISNVYPRDNKELTYGGWYWHFVDVIWIWVVLFIYIWPWANALVLDN